MNNLDLLLDLTVNSIHFSSEHKAKLILSALKRRLKSQGYVHIYDYFFIFSKNYKEAMNFIKVFLKNENDFNILLTYGWTNLNNAYVRRITFKEYLRNIDDTLLEEELSPYKRELINCLAGEERGFYIILPKVVKLP